MGARRGTSRTETETSAQPLTQATGPGAAGWHSGLSLGEMGGTWPWTREESPLPTELEKGEEKQHVYS